MIADAVCVLTSVALIALFSATVRCQFDTQLEFFQRRKPLGLLRQYRLFSPLPIQSDIHLVLRDFGRDGAPRPCREVPFHRLRRWSDAFWNPWKRRSLPLLALMRELTSTATALDDDCAAVQLSRSYLVLLGIISAEPAGDDVAARQFLLVERFGHEPARESAVLFCSAVHRLERHTA